jgi:hypothetical protein
MKLQQAIDNETDPTQKAKRQKEKDDDTREFKKGVWETKLKTENAKVNSRVSFSDTDAPDQYDKIIV